MFDSQLMVRFQAGDRSALGELYERYKPMLTRFIASWGWAEDAEDIVHETFIKAMRYPENYNPDVAVSTWFCGIAKQRMISNFHNQNRDKRRGVEISIDQEREVPLEIPCAEQNPEQILESKMEVDLINKKLGTLPMIHQQIVSLRSYGYKYDQIAEILEIPLNTVKTRIHRARKAL